MNVIETENLSKTFRVKQKEKGIAGSMRAIFHPQIKEIPAVSRVSLLSSAPTERAKALLSRC